MMKRLELARVRICERCGRGRAELRSEDGKTLTVPLDPVRARELADPRPADDVRAFTDLVLAELGAAGAGRLRDAALSPGAHATEDLAGRPLDRRRSAHAGGCEHRMRRVGDGTPGETKLRRGAAGQILDRHLARPPMAIDVDERAV